MRSQIILYNHIGWSQDEIQAALLGLVEEAQQMIIKRSQLKHKASRFPAFWGPNFVNRLKSKEG